jgi:cytochrome c-type biogenesis protein
MNRAAVGGAMSRRTVVAVIVSLIVLGLAVAAGLGSPPTGGSPVIFVDRLSSAITNAFSIISGRVLFVYAFVLGAATVFNPCGFGLIPAYLGLYLGEGDRPTIRATAKLLRSLKISLAVAISFTAVFGAAGAIFSLAASSLVGLLPWLGLGVGIVLVGVGGAMLADRSLTFSASERAADAIGQRAGGSGVRAFAAFGLAYALASLGCSFPLFFALVGTAMAAGSMLTAIGAFILFGIGMATMLGVLAIVAAVVSTEVVRGGRQLTRVVSNTGAVLVLLSGGYVVYYWLSAGRILLG